MNARRRILISVTACALTLPLYGAESPLRVSGPFVYENLDLYLIHGPDRIDKRSFVPLGEALERKMVVVRETGNVSELSIENVSDKEVYVQSGDIVKGGKQDRILGKDMVLQPHSGRIPVASFCVEQGRWQARGTEASDRFSSSSENAGVRELRLANIQGSQTEVW